MNPRSLSRRHFTSALAALLAAPTVHAQAWPAKPIRMIVPYPPGGFTDVTARLVSQKLQERLGQTVLVDNKPGANGIIGADALAKSPRRRLHLRGGDRGARGQHDAVPEAAVRPAQGPSRRCR